MAPPPDRRTVRPALSEGDVLAGRYRLTRRIARGQDPDVPGAVLWQAEDEVLARCVAVKVLTTGGRREAGANRFLDAGAAAGAVDLPVFARVYDAAVEERDAERLGEPAGTIDIAYVISEWVEGRTVAELLRTDGPLEPGAALDLVVAAADALEAAAQRGVSHGRLHPGNVAVTADGRVKILDLGVAAVLQPAAERPGQDAGPPPAERDTRDLAAILYALLTGRWPASATSQPAAGLPTAAGKDGALLRPRQLRAAVPRAVDDLVMRALEPGRAADRPALRTPARLATALSEARSELDRPPVERPSRVPPLVRRLMPLLLVAGFLAAVGTTSYLLGLAIGEVRSRGGELEALAEPSTGPSTATGGGPIDLRASARVIDFDPPPGDGREASGAVGNAFDGDPTTAWETERYETPELSGLKPGVGLLVDLGAPTPVAAVQVGLRPGSRVELRAADAVGATIADFPVVTTADSTGEVARLEAGRTARYWLVVLTRLPPERGGFRGAISELLFVRG